MRRTRVPPPARCTQRSREVKTACQCKVSTDLEPEQAQWVEDELSRNRAYRDLSAAIKEKFGVQIYTRTLVDHKKKHMVAAQGDSEWRKTLDAVRDELRREMNLASVLIKPLYLVLLRNLDGLEDAKVSQDAVIKASKALSDITGNASDRDALAVAAIAAATRRSGE